MPREVSEWIGNDADTNIPPRVKLRIYTKANGLCQKCKRTAHIPEVDHTVALVNYLPAYPGDHGNRESNLRLLCQKCHRGKTSADVAEKSFFARRQKKRLGFTKSRRPMPGGRQSKWRKRISGAVVPR